jgi:ribosomal protein S18 acetylase RimI-like enzyme
MAVNPNCFQHGHASYYYEYRLFRCAVVAESSSLLLPERDQRPRIVAYALGSTRILEKTYADESPPPHYYSGAQRRQLDAFHQGQDICPRVTCGHTILLAVAHSHRRMGLTSMLLQYLHSNMNSKYGAVVCDLFVRVSNEAAIRLYEREGIYLCQHIVAFYKLFYFVLHHSIGTSTTGTSPTTSTTGTSTTAIRRRVRRRVRRIRRIYECQRVARTVDQDA